jgi:hypothetical protein
MQNEKFEKMKLFDGTVILKECCDKNHFIFFRNDCWEQCDQSGWNFAIWEKIKDLVLFDTFYTYVHV